MIFDEKFYVVKKADVEKYFNNQEKMTFKSMLGVIAEGRENDGKTEVGHYVVSTDEPYAEEVYKVIEENEDKKLAG